jgi:hypothetical protein
MYTREEMEWPFQHGFPRRPGSVIEWRSGSGESRRTDGTVWTAPSQAPHPAHWHAIARRSSDLPLPVFSAGPAAQLKPGRQSFIINH